MRLYDGARALILSGRWKEAHSHLLKGDGIARRLYGGRQVVVIALSTSGDTEGALRLQRRTPHEQPWEYAVAGALTVLCQLIDGTPAPGEAAVMLDRYRQLARSAELLVFDTRLGLAITDLAAAIGEEDLAADAARTVAERTLPEPGWLHRPRSPRPPHRVRAPRHRGPVPARRSGRDGRSRPPRPEQ
ncbi:hypothetical protein [Kitasatospora sp. P5_F3]